MPAPNSRVRAATAALSLGVYADLAFNLYSATNSSPQTTELFAGEREHTLMKYVRFGHCGALAFGIIGSLLDRTLWPLIGTVGVGVTMHGMYRHAVKAGRSVAAPTGSDATARQAQGLSGRVLRSR